MAKYLPAADHPLLSDEAKALTPENLAIMAGLAEDVLGLTSAPTYTEATAVAAATNAVAIQISYYMVLPVEMQFLTSKSRGARSESYRANASGSAMMVSSLARQIVQGLAGGEGYVSMRSYRGRGAVPPGPAEQAIQEIK